MDTEVEKSEAAKREEEILAFWAEHQVAKKISEKAAPKGDFIFYEGPPTANGRPGVHHLESRSFKDALPRYKTMQGFRVPRRAGWDTHGLPVELEVEKELGFKGKKDIETYGIAEFNKKCRESVMRYVGEWRKFSERMGYGVDQDKAYFTFDASYMESLFSVMKKVDADGRLFKDYKVVPWCARCGTALSSHELAQGYEDVKDLSVTAKFKVKNPEQHNLPPESYLLAWTTTPWTLPGNVGLAVNPKVNYVVIEKKDEGTGELVRFILAKERLETIFGGQEYRTVEDRKGSELVGLEYEPLYPYAPLLAPDSEKPKFAGAAYRVYPAAFVTTEDGTGIVHTAVMYGQEDFELGQAVGLPKVHLVGPDGRFIPGTDFLEGRFVKDEDVAVDIVKDLAGRGLLFDKAKYEHSYPFCWRCKTPLIYYARDSWYIRMSDLRETLLKENAKVNWEPSHIQEGRMGEWLAGAKDWAISRERYWGTPLPLWQDESGTERLVVGSVEELKSRVRKSGNIYFTMRHGESVNNVSEINSSRLDDLQSTHHLTEAGRAQVRASAETMKDSVPDLIFVSPFLRTQETAGIVAEVLGLGPEHIITDPRLTEIDTGVYHGDTYAAYRGFYTSLQDHFLRAPEGAETFAQVRKRMGDFLYDIETRYTGKRILIVSHGDPLWLLRLAASGNLAQDAQKSPYPENKGVAELLDFVPLPHNEDYELDLHRPYIDDVVLIGDSGAELHRVSEVMDVWFDSGAVPYAQDHYPFENKEWVETKGIPADFISEGLDQTRGWFYTLLAVGVLMGRGVPYKNVICLGLILDAKGQKMSKSRGNGVDPWKAMDQWGADTLRFWMYSVNQPGDSKNFDEKTVKEAARALSWLENSTRFYTLFKENRGEGIHPEEEVLDRWMHARTHMVIRDVTRALDSYKPYDATRSLAGLFEDLSQWYVRRVRDRVREGDPAALLVLQSTLGSAARMLAPFAPFLAEWVYQEVREESDPISVHLADWPVAGDIDEELILEMVSVRALASEALMLRQRALRKVRQPLARLSIVESLSPELAKLLAEEVNVKEVVGGALQIALETELTPELVREGDVREFARALADARKALALVPQDEVDVAVSVLGEAVLEDAVLPGVRLMRFDGGEDAPYTAELSIGAVRFSIISDAA